MAKKFSKSDLLKCQEDGLYRLAKFLHAPEAVLESRDTLIRWLIWMGYCIDPNAGGWRL